MFPTSKKILRYRGVFFAEKALERPKRKGLEQKTPPVSFPDANLLCRFACVQVRVLIDDAPASHSPICFLSTA